MSDSGSSPAVSINSPLIRRAGMKHFFSDSGANEPDNKNKEGGLFPTETDNMKTAASQFHVIPLVSVPSPIFLWRFKALLFLMWCIICCKISWDSAMRMDAGVRNLFLYEAFLYYNPLLLVTLMIWLWGLNLWVFAQSSVNYPKIFDLAHNHLSHQEIWKVPTSPFLFENSSVVCAIWITIVVPSSMTTYLYLYSCKEVSLAASQPAITFSDFFMDNLLTSMSKVLSDLERFVCRMVNRQVATIAWLEADSICGSHSLEIPIVLVFPYMCRLFQCIRQCRDTKEKTSLLNALKYATAIPVIFLSALKYHVFPEEWRSFYRPLWLLSSLTNSLYSFYWDVTRDWDMSIFSRIFNFKNPSLFSSIFYGRRWLYFWVLGSNLILRCTWTYKLSAHLRHNYLTVFAITALEIFCRFQWVFFCVENEWHKMTHKPSPECMLWKNSQARKMER